MQSCPAVENKIALASNSEWNRWIDEDEGMKFWPMGLYPDIFNYLLFFPLELGSKNLNEIPKHIVIINQVGCNHCYIITLQVVISAS